MKTTDIFLLILRVFLGALFIVSGFQKLSVPIENFQAVMEKFEIVQGLSAAILSHMIPWCEFIFGVFLVLGFWTELSLLALWYLNMLFIGVLLSAIFRKLPIDECGCFGKALSLPLPKILILDIVFFGLFAVLFFFGRNRRLPAIDRFFEGSS